MKISIDTKEDSPEEIRKLIKMLLALVGDNSVERSPPASGEGLFDMFGDPQASTSQQQQLGNGANGMDVNDFIDKQDSSESQPENDDNIRIVPY